MIDSIRTLTFVRSGIQGSLQATLAISLPSPYKKKYVHLAGSLFKFWGDVIVIYEWTVNYLRRQYSGADKCVL